MTKNQPPTTSNLVPSLLLLLLLLAFAAPVAGMTMREAQAVIERDYRNTLGRLFPWGNPPRFLAEYTDAELRAELQRRPGLWQQIREAK